MKTHYDRASSLHLCLGRIGSISSFTVRLYSLMAAGTQTARGGFMAPQLLYDWAKCHHLTVCQTPAGGGPDVIWITVGADSQTRKAVSTDTPAGGGGEPMRRESDS